MVKVKAILLTSISVFLMALVLISILLHYPLNLIVDGVLLAIIGISTILYLMIWSLQSDGVVICTDHISIFTRKFPFMMTKERRIYSKTVEYFTVYGNDSILVLKTGELAHIQDSRSLDGTRVHDIESTLRGMKIKYRTYADHIKLNTDDKRSDLSRI